jgi:hypothetical protein
VGRYNFTKDDGQDYFLIFEKTRIVFPAPLPAPTGE